jgi:hypothetical protein
MHVRDALKRQDYHQVIGIWCPDQEHVYGVNFLLFLSVCLQLIDQTLTLSLLILKLTSIIRTFCVSFFFLALGWRFFLAFIDEAKSYRVQVNYNN